MGLALRDTTTGNFVLNASRPGHRFCDWKQIAWMSAPSRDQRQAATRSISSTTIAAGLELDRHGHCHDSRHCSRGHPYSGMVTAAFGMPNGLSPTGSFRRHDPDGDGMINQQEFTFGLDPTPAPRSIRSPHAARARTTLKYTTTPRRRVSAQLPASVCSRPGNSRRPGDGFMPTATIRSSGAAQVLPTL